MFKRIVLVVGLVLLVLGMLGGLKFQQIKEGMAKLENFAPPPATVSAVNADTQQWRPQVASVGTLNAVSGIDLASEVSGIVEEILFESGDTVAKGQPLLKLNDEVEQSNLASYLAQAELAKIKYERTADLLKKKSVSQTDFDQASADLKVANAMVEQTRANIAKKNITAPFTGTLGIRQFSLGEFIDKGKALVSLQDDSVLYADFAVPEQFLPSLYQGQEVHFTVASAKDKVFSGKVIAIEAKVDESTRNIKLRAQLANPDGELRPGMYADIRLLMKESKTPVVVPATSIVYSPFGDAIFEVITDEQGDLAVKRRYIKVGERRGDLVEVISGLEAGTQVVNSGTNKLENGSKIKLSDAVQL